MKINISKKKPKVFVALSGGVDSSVAMLLLLKNGYQVEGVFMKNWSGDDFGIQTECPWEKDQKDAEEVCKFLGVPFRSFNFEKQYRQSVVDYFFSEYEKGRTPNPDIMCNKEIKFKLFLDKAIENGADLIATGHYARIKRVGDKFKLLSGVDPNKNQVYFLYTLNQEQLSRTLFPIGELTKQEVRKIAFEIGLPNANKPDSQGICFIGKINVLEFLLAKIHQKKGLIIDIETGEVLGEHKGVYFYTIGQGAKVPGQSEKYFFCKKDLEKNIMYACKGSDNSNLFSKILTTENIHWIGGIAPNLDQITGGSIRYRQEPQKIKKIEKYKNGLKVEFLNPQKAIASGQSLVLFKNDECLGGGIIA
ncbi:MAG: tRNA-specific 2-thiouridylase MnmA [Candidatus Dojkabacteria bacterium]|nr:MAG: tRNA-specific 2-thiouridylase MnmA [Candidatus Dojkabacteria bacterium]